MEPPKLKYVATRAGCGISPDELQHGAVLSAMEGCPLIPMTSDSVGLMGEETFSSFEIRERIGAVSFFGLTTRKAVRKVIPSILNGADRTVNLITGIRVDGAGPIQDMTIGAAPTAQETTAIVDIMTNAGGGMPTARRGLFKSVRQMSTRELSVRASEKSLSAMWYPTTIRAGMIL